MTESYLDLSTSHLTQETMELLERAGDRTQVAPEVKEWPAMTIASYAEGVFFTVPSDTEIRQFRARALIGMVPDDLAAVLAYAKSQGVTLVRLDADSNCITGLPIYDW